jgi:hypothetical protein
MEVPDMTNEASELPGDKPEAISLGRVLQSEEQVLPLLRTIALSAGELHGQILREIRRQRRHYAGDPAGRMKAGLAKLQARRLVSESEAGQLNHIIDAVTSDKDLDVVAREVQDIHWRLVDESAGPIALAISNMAAGSTSYARDRPVQVISDENGEDVHGGISEGDLEGMILGAGWGAQAGGIAGGLSAGPGGLVAGLLAGGILGAIIGGGIGSS